MPKYAPQSLSWFHSDAGVEPDADPRFPWAKVGAQVPAFVADGLYLADVSAVEGLHYFRKLWASDNGAVGPARTTDNVAIQAYVRGISQAPTWASGASPICLYLYDGQYAIALSIGPALRLINPINGQVVAELASNHPWTQGLIYELRKVGAARWDVYVNGVRVGSVSYTRAPVLSIANGRFPARAGWGMLNPAGQATAVFNSIEVGFNQAVPPAWKVQRYYNSMPPTIQKKWTENARAALRAILGAVEDGVQILDEAWTQLTADRLDVDRYEAEGSVLPELERTPWTKTDAGGQITGLVRQRVRFDVDGTQAATNYAIDLDVPVVPLPTRRETLGGCKVIFRSYTAEPEGRVGLYILVRDGSRVATAQLYEVPGSPGQWRWAFTTLDRTPGNPVVVVGTEEWPINPFVEHDVEVQVYRNDHALLLVNGYIVDRLPYALLGVDVNPPRVELGHVGQVGPPIGPVAVFDLSYLRAAQRLADLTKRQLFEQNMIERQVWTSGCDRNDELEEWGRAHFLVQQLRGTTIGMEIEARRLACNEDTRVVVDANFAGWVLEASYPEVTPIFLEADGIVAIITLEFTRDSPNWTDQSLADLFAQYLVPLSTQELRYQIARIVRTIPPGITSPSPGVSRVRVADTAPFAAGDEVTIRLDDNSLQEATTILVVNEVPPFLDVVELQNSYPVGSVVRIVLATT